MLSLVDWALDLVSQLGPVLGQAAQQASPGVNSGFTDYTAAVARQLLLIGVLVTILLGGGLLILNLGLLSKRREDKVGRRAPSEVGILKGTMWPEESDEETVLPAEEEPEKQRRHDRAA